MRLLLTRAVEDAARTREKLVALGHHVLISPVIEIVAAPAAWPSGVIDALLATSGQAFASAPDGLTPEARRIIPLYLVGQRTEEAARHHGFLGDATVAANATALAVAMGNIPYRGTRILYLAGHDRKPDIETALDVIGQKLDVLEVYEARAREALSAETQKALRLDLVDGVVHFSRRSAAIFVAAASSEGLDLRRPTHFCLSEDVAAPLREGGCATIKISAKPNESDLIGLIGEP